MATSHEGDIHEARCKPVGRAVVWTAAITALGGLLFGYGNGVVSEIEREMVEP
jgi:hypothetical protein